MSTQTQSEKVIKFGYIPATIAVKDIVDNTENARIVFDDKKVESLAQSIKENGLQNRIVVRKLPGGRYEVKQGSRRLRAAKLLKMETIEAHVAPDDMGDREHAVNGLVENLQRENLTPYEEAMGYRQVMTKYNVSGAELSRMTGKSSSHINNSVRAVTNLAPDVLKQWAAGNKMATFDTVVKLASIKDKDGEPDYKAQTEAWSKICAGARFVGNNLVGADGEGEESEEGEEETESASRKQKHRILMKNVMLVQASLKEHGDKLKAPGDMKSWTVSLIAYMMGKRAKPPEGIVLPEAKEAPKKKGGKKSKKGDKKD